MEKKHLHLLWTNADPLTAHHMVMMYATNSKLHGWWDEVTVIIWGATARLVAEDEAIQQRMELAVHAGVKFSACVACANALGVTQKLLDLGLEVIPWGQPLTQLLQGGETVLSI